MLKLTERTPCKPKCTYSPNSSWVLSKHNGSFSRVLHFKGYSGKNGLRARRSWSIADCGTCLLIAAIHRDAVVSAM